MSVRLPRLHLLVSLLLVLLATAVTTPEVDARRKTGTRKEAPAPAKKSTKGKSSNKSKTKKPAPRTSGDVRREKKRTAEEIKRTQKDIAANESNTRSQLKRLQRLDVDITASQTRVATLNTQVNDLRRRISALADTVSRTEGTVERLRAAYGRNLAAMRRQRQGVSDLTFIFSAENFSAMLSRVRYLRELSAAQSQRTRQLRVELDSLRQRRARLDTLEASLSTTLAGVKAEDTRLRNSREAASVLVDSLRRQGSTLRRVLSEKEALARRLDAELDRIIAEEARKAAEEEARRKAAEEARRKAEAEAAERRRAEEAKQQGGKNKKKDTPQSKPTPSTKPTKPAPASTQPAKPVSPLSGGFAANKGRLPWPVDKAFTVSSSFGRSSHPELARVDVQNNGIDLRTAPGASARAVFPGTVSSIFRLDSYHNIVILRHGNYLTVYAGIEQLKVHKGQEVTAGQLLGTLAPDPEDDGHPTLHFEIRNEKTKLNPAEWLRKP
ncbi:MAG: peptidoglycan DD-metalloendopeptidase family protein [Muribaculaceae bacterium]|nr:peptidoglycan DD-metalloendopeptidase family protein [Muribaculaceae bacterium]